MVRVCVMLWMLLSAVSCVTAISLRGLNAAVEVVRHEPASINTAVPYFPLQ